MPIKEAESYADHVLNEVIQGIKSNEFLFLSDMDGISFKTWKKWPSGRNNRKKCEGD
jgi:hypothetical protein